MHTVSTRVMPRLRSVISVMAPGSASEKLGQPQWALNLVFESNSLASQQIQW
jgi:hypothetical protein